MEGEEEEEEGSGVMSRCEDIIISDPRSLDPLSLSLSLDLCVSLSLSLCLVLCGQSVQLLLSQKVH
jgi:hypothetical protein